MRETSRPLSAQIPRPLTISFTRCSGTPMCAAKSTWVTPSGFRNSLVVHAYRVLASEVTPESLEFPRGRPKIIQRDGGIEHVEPAQSSLHDITRKTPGPAIGRSVVKRLGGLVAEGDDHARILL